MPDSSLCLEGEGSVLGSAGHEDFVESINIAAC